MIVRALPTSLEDVHVFQILQTLQVCVRETSLSYSTSKYTPAAASQSTSSEHHARYLARGGLRVPKKDDSLFGEDCVEKDRENVRSRARGVKVWV
jgi:hypothetical protein